MTKKKSQKKVAKKKASKKSIKTPAAKKAIKKAVKKKDLEVIPKNPAVKEKSKPLSTFCCELICENKYTNAEISAKLKEAYPNKSGTDSRIVSYYKSTIRAGKMERLGFTADMVGDTIRNMKAKKEKTESKPTERVATRIKK